MSKLGKKSKYVVQSIIVGGFILLFSFYPQIFTVQRALYLTVLVSLFGTLFIHYPNTNLKNIFATSYLAFSLIFGALLFMHFFPNLAILFKFVAVFIFSVLYYIVSLVDNIFLVVQDREDMIPLYRVALTWEQILSSVIAIPLFAGIFKLNANALVQSFGVGAFAFLFCLYQIWSLAFDEGARKVRVGDTLLLSGLVFFLVSSANMALSFLPTEAFLRAIVASSVLMFGLSFVNGYLKNEITQKLLFRNLFIILFFSVLTVIFQA